MGVAVVVAAAAIAGSLSLNTKMIIRVPKNLVDEDEEVMRNRGRVPIFIGGVPETRIGTVVHFFS